ncbi:MarR family transcriptional regulator (plasmid) [Fulvitalea axinellae]|uniref:MarR family transcriptional regulator n=1 Tax=Fulvitalea axinellae TaxID=1182444 RepID=A0AAU9CWM6_9BACT|nr:MarR family transcriptional regulator [Fulvitalea axinellae]
MGNIGEEIKQKSFQSQRKKASLNLLYTASWYERGLKQVWSQFGISHQQFNVLRILKGAKKPVTLMYITERMLDRNSNASRLIDKLLDKEYVTREICPDNRRKMDISITPTGIDLLDRIEEPLKEVVDKHFNLSEEESRILSDLLDKLRG